MDMVSLHRDMEQWTREWLEGERTKGLKRLEIKVKGRRRYTRKEKE